MNGRIIGIKVNNEFVPCETNCDFSVDGERISIASKENGNWRKSIAGYRSWKVNVNGKLEINSSPAGAMELIKTVMNGEDVELVMTMRVDNAQVFIIQGSASTTNVTINAPSSGEAAWSGSFEGNGAFVLSYDIYNTIINGMPIDEEKPFVVDTGGV